MRLGAHESISGGLHLAFERAREDRCECMQIFTKNSNQWREPLIDEQKLAAWNEARGLGTVEPVLSHTSYLINLASDSAPLLEQSRAALVAEVLRCERLGIGLVVMHPGFHKTLSEEQGIDRVAESLGHVYGQTGPVSVRVLLETTAGQGASLGWRFEQLAAIIERSPARDSLGICFDTAHAFAAGYDIASPDGYEATFSRLDHDVGLERLAAFHLNDSRKPLGSRVDRHENIGKGLLGAPVFERLQRDARFESLPAVLETPPLASGDRGFKENLELLRGLVPARGSARRTRSHPRRGSR